MSALAFIVGIVVYRDIVKASGGAKKRRPSTTQTPNIEETAQLIESATRGDQKAFRKTVRARVAILQPVSYVI